MGRTLQVKPTSVRAGISLLLSLCVLSTCTTINSPTITVTETTERLSSEDVQTILAHAVEQASRRGVAIVGAVTDRFGTVLGVLRMTGSTGSRDAAVTKARTAAFLSSDTTPFLENASCSAKASAVVYPQELHKAVLARQQSSKRTLVP